VTHLLRCQFLAACVWLASTYASAGSLEQGILVRVELLSHPSGLCISQSLSQQTQATVTVTCSSNEFVSIEAVPGQAYSLVHGGAHRWLPRNQGVSQAGIWREGTLGIGTGTVTGLRVLRVSEADERLELLVSF
jgi:hypothetical protein